MIAAAMAAILATAPPAAPDVGPRIAAAMAAAQSLQGPLDGAWTLLDAGRHPLFHLVIVDVAGRGKPPEGAWRQAAGGTEYGVVTAIRRDGRRLRIGFAPIGSVVILTLSRDSARIWRGWMIQDGVRTPVALRRDTP